MNDQPTNLPFPLDPNYDYILTEDDRRRFAPKLATDEFWWSNQWRTTENPPGGFALQNFYRRRKSSGWVSVKERLPEANQPFLAVCDSEILPFTRGVTDPDRLIQNRFIWWMPWELPALPQPPKPAAEVAFEEWLESVKDKPNTHPITKGAARTVFLAAIEWAKAHKGEI